MPDVDRQGIRIHYSDTGDGVPLILGHSFLCSGAMWEQQVEPLSRVARVINVDFRGHGLSGHVNEPFDLYDLVDDLVAVLDRLGVERAVWAGLSMGGMVALRAALTVPHRVAGLIILDSDAGSEGWLRNIRHRALATVARMFGMGPVLPAVSKQMFGRTTLATRPGLVAKWRGRFARVHVPSIRHCMGMLTGRDAIVGRLGTIAVPTLVIVGEEDLALPIERSRTIADGIPGARLLAIPGAGHLSCLERPDVVSEAIVALIGDLNIN